MKRNIACLALALAFALSAGIIRAQGQEPGPETAPALPMMTVQNLSPDDGEMGPGFEGRVELLGFGGMRGNKVVKGVPFSAVAVSETKQTLPDGTHITRTTKTVLYRDSQGRFRKEVTLPSIGPLAASGPTHTFIVIHDPVAGTGYVLEPDQKIARTMPARGAMRVPDGAGPVTVQKFIGRAEGTVQTESLEPQTIEGVSAQGTRHTRTIPVGEIGNDQPITVVSERWYSPDLQMVVMSKHSDPRFGDTTYTVTNIQRSEPSASLFTVPSDYTVEQGGPLQRHLSRFPGAPSTADAPPPPPDN